MLAPTSTGLPQGRLGEVTGLQRIRNPASLDVVLTPHEAASEPTPGSSCRSPGSGPWAADTLGALCMRSVLADAARLES